MSDAISRVLLCTCNWSTSIRKSHLYGQIKGYSAHQTYHMVEQQDISNALTECAGDAL